MVKAIMMIQRGRILPNAGFEEFNQNIAGREKLKVRDYCSSPSLVGRGERMIIALTMDIGSNYDVRLAALRA